MEAVIHVSRVTFHKQKMQQSGNQTIRAAIGSFTACTPALSLLETTVAVEKTAAVGVWILLSPVGSSFERFQNLQQQGEIICRSMKSISWGGPVGRPKMHGQSGGGLNRLKMTVPENNLSPRGFLRENPGANKPIKSTSQKGRRWASEPNE